MAIVTFTKTGTKATTAVKLDKAVFGAVPTDHTLLKEAYVAHLAAKRENLAVTKTRGLVSGGGRKPWKQKGTGRARFGSSRNPIWRGGGIAFGPTGEENYVKRLNTKAKRLALRQALSIAAQENRINVIETFECKDGKVSQTAALLKKTGIKGNILLVVSEKDQLVERATGNMPGIKAVQANYLSTFDILNADSLLLSTKALAVITEWLSKEQS